MYHRKHSAAQPNADAQIVRHIVADCRLPKLLHWSRIYELCEYFSSLIIYHIPEFLELINLACLNRVLQNTNLNSLNRSSFSRFTALERLYVFCFTFCWIQTFCLGFVLITLNKIVSIENSTTIALFNFHLMHSRRCRHWDTCASTKIQCTVIVQLLISLNGCNRGKLRPTLAATHRLNCVANI